jgi:hypothetical protein
MKYVITFESVHFVMKAEKALKKKEIPVRLIPTPRKISSDCGMSLEVETDNAGKLRQLLETRGCVILGVYDSPD